MKYSDRQIVNPNCKDCIYRKAWSGLNTASYACEYLLQTGEIRGSTVENCNKKITRKKGSILPRKWNF